MPRYTSHRLIKDREMEYAIWVEMDERYAIVRKEFAEERVCWQTKSAAIEIFEDYKLAVIGGWTLAAGHHAAVAWSDRTPANTNSSRSSCVLVDATHSLLRAIIFHDFLDSAIVLDLDLGTHCACSDLVVS